MTHLHEEALHQRLPDVEVVVCGVKVGARALQVEPVHYSGELLAHIVGRLERAEVDKVIVAPARILIVCFFLGGKKVEYSFCRYLKIVFVYNCATYSA